MLFGLLSETLPDQDTGAALGTIWPAPCCSGIRGRLVINSQKREQERLREQRGRRLFHRQPPSQLDVVWVLRLRRQMLVEERLHLVPGDVVHIVIEVHVVGTFDPEQLLGLRG
jgi:hypothetical protein